MEKITKDLEKIRDLVMNNPAAKIAFDSIYEEANSKCKSKDLKMINDEIAEDCELSENSRSNEEYDLQSYNSREISDIIHSRIRPLSKLKAPK